MSAATVEATARRGGVRALWAGNPGAVVQRGFLAARSSSWAVVLSGFFEPVFYLASMGLGLGKLIGDVETSQGVPVSYAAFIAPALLAVSAMNGAIYDSTWNVFFKLNYGKLYEGMLATSLGPLDVALGEILYALLRGLLYATGFMIVLMEWTCTQLMEPHLDSGEGSLGTHVDVSHLAATPIGFTVKVDAELVAVEGRKLTFKVTAHDGKDRIGEGRHERVVVAWDRFNAKVAEKAKSAAEMVN